MTVQELRDALTKIVDDAQGDLPVMYYDDEMGMYIHIEYPTIRKACSVILDGTCVITDIVDI